tara:strand:- start:3268 stop:4224 length:957 start_codon:yes stop_codon:yes gene_type:complete
MIPIKMLPDNHELLKFIGEEPTLDHDDFLEREVINGSVDATKLLAIENASEIARRFIQRHYVDILKSISSESKKKVDVVYRCKNVTTLTRSNNNIEYLHLEKDLEEGGHSVYLRVDNTTKYISVWDSMGEGAYLNEFDDVIKDVYSGYRVRDNSIGFQPTGGFTQETPEQMMDSMYVFRNPAYANRAWRISQYDELSQHHFCYAEAFVAMAFDSLPMKRVGPEDPRERLRFIKKVVWGLINKFYTGSRDTSVWKYFETYFPYYLSSWNSDGTKMFLRNGMFQIPKKNTITYLLRTEHFDTINTRAWTVKNILKWAAKS